jgi:precorrin-2 dehydrogenase/sirohydrochlorin ferrochelatase
VPDYFPAFLDLSGRRCLVVGGGEIAERKVRALLDCAARVIVVSPALTPGLSALARADRIVHHRRAFLRTDVRGCAVVIAATGAALADAAVAAAARRRRALVNVVDRPAQCDFIFPSVLRRGNFQIAVSTGGRSPALAREIRRRLEPLFGPEYAELVERVGEERARARASAATPEARTEGAERVVESALAGRREWSEPSALRFASIPRASKNCLTLLMPRAI